MTTDTQVRWTRREAGNYVTTIDGVQVSIVNMKDPRGPNAPRWQGVIPSWEVRIGGRGEYDVGARVANTVWTRAEAKQWVEEWAASRTGK